MHSSRMRTASFIPCVRGGGGLSPEVGGGGSVLPQCQCESITLSHTSYAGGNKSVI